jgi:hypothetical protein
MRRYVIVTGARVVLESAHVLRDPVFVITSALAVALMAWAWRLLR